MKRRIMKTLDIREISGVDVPAQEGAKVVLMKRRVLKLKRKPGESKDDYVSRFMGSEKMKSEYPDEKQRLAVAHSMAKEHCEEGNLEKGSPGQPRVPAGSSRGGQWTGGGATLVGTFRVEGGTIAVQDIADASGAKIGTLRYDSSHGIAEVTSSSGKTKLFGGGNQPMHTTVKEALEWASGGFQKNNDKGEESADAPVEKQVSADDIAAGGGNNPENREMTPEEKAAQAALEKRLERAEKLAELTDAQKAHFAKLDEAGREAFLALNKDAKAEALSKAAVADPVVETIDGMEFRKSDDPRLLAMAKRAREDRLAREKAEAVAKAADLRKRAGELKHLPGTEDERMDLLAAVDTLPVEKRGKILENLRAQDAGLAEAYAKKGVRGEPAQAGGLGKLEQLAKSARAANPKLTEDQAMAQILKTPEGREAYAEHLSAR